MMGEEYLLEKQAQRARIGKTPLHTGYTRKNLHDLKNFLLCELFSYEKDFDDYVHRLFEHETGHDPIKGFRVTQNLIGRGGYGEIYEVLGDKGERYALKLFYPQDKFDPKHHEARRRSMDCVRENITSNMDLFLDAPFIPIRYTALHSKDTHGIGWAYISDYVPGHNLVRLIHDDDEILKDHELTGKILLTYASMLKGLHETGKVFIDNSLSSILVNGDDIRVCDVDFISPISGLDDYKNYPCQSAYMPQEVLLGRAPCISSDLESFARMTHHLMLRTPLNRYTPSAYEPSGSGKLGRRDEADDVRKCPEGLGRRLPDNLQQVVSALINYPKDKSITADDFIYAINKDFSF